MRILSTLDSNPRQTIYFTTDDKQRIKLSFYFLPTQSGWFVDIDTEGFKLNGTRIFAYPNILDKYHNIIIWGINVSTLDGLDPYQVTDFSSGYCQISILDEDEVNKVKDFLDGKTQ